MFYLEFWDETGKTRLDYYSVNISVPALDEWQQAIIRKAAPANARYASVIIYSSSYQVGTSNFDDILLATMVKNQR